LEPAIPGTIGVVFMTKRIAVLEPPFIEPGMPYPEIHRIVRIFQSLGSAATPIDINVRLYRQMLNNTPSFYNHDLLTKCLGKALFIDQSDKSIEKILWNNRQDGGYLDNAGLPLLLSRALSLLSGDSLQVNHDDYVISQEILNGFLDYTVKMVDPNAQLWLDYYQNEINIHRSQEVLEYAKNPANRLRRLYRTFLDKEVSGWDYDTVLIVIRNQSQQLPGIVLSAWLKMEYDFNTALTGNHLDTILSIACPAGIFEVCNEIIAFKIDYSAKSFLADVEHPYILKEKSADYPHFDLSMKEVDVLPGIIPAIDTAEYITPFPVVGASVSYRCYWSNCAFCSLADEKKYPFNRLKSNDIHIDLKTLKEKYDISHVQFLDYATPPALLIRDFCNYQDLDIYWAAQLRFENSYAAGNIFRQLYNTGCTLLSWGFESGSSKVLESVRKGGITDNEKRAELLRKSSDSGILNHLFVIAGLPGETDGDFIETVHFIYENQDFVNGLEVYPYQLVPHTRLFRTLAGKRIIDKDEEDWNLDISFRERSEVEVVEERVEYIKKTFGFLSQRSKTNDFLEGHLTLKRSHFNEDYEHEFAL